MLNDNKLQVFSHLVDLRLSLLADFWLSGCKANGLVESVTQRFQLKGQLRAIPLRLWQKNCFVKRRTTATQINIIYIFLFEQTQYINPLSVRIVEWVNSCVQRALVNAPRARPAWKAVDLDNFSLRRTTYFRLGMWVFDRKLSLWGIWMCHHYIDSVKQYRYIGIWNWEG